MRRPELEVLPVRAVNENTKVGSRREKIIRTAMKLFADHGYTEVSGRQIAAAANVSTRLIWHHFGSKEQLRQEIDDFVLESAHSAAIGLEGSVEDRLVQLYSRFWAMIDSFGISFIDYLRGLIVDNGERGRLAYLATRRIIMTTGLLDFPDGLTPEERRHREIAIHGIFTAHPIFRPHIGSEYRIDVYSENEYRERVKAMIVAIEALHKGP